MSSEVDLLQWLTDANFAEQQAAILEGRNWQVAAEWWDKAASHHKGRISKERCEARANYCRLRLNGVPKEEANLLCFPEVENQEP